MVVGFENEEARMFDLMADLIDEIDDALCAILLHAEAIVDEMRLDQPIQRKEGFRVLRFSFY